MTEYTTEHSASKRSAASIDRPVDRSVAFAESSVGFLIVARDGIILEANRAMLAQSRMLSSAVVGSTLWECDWQFCSGSDDVRLRDAFRNAAEGSKISLELGQTAVDRTQRSYELSLTPIGNGTGLAECILVESTDVTARVLALNDLALRKARLRLIFDGAHDLILLIRVQEDGGYRCESVNKSYLRATGLREDQVVGRMLPELLPAEAIRRAAERFREARNSDEPISYRETVLSGTRESVVETRLSSIRDSGGRVTHLLSMSRDITDRIFAERALRSSERRIRGAVDASLDALVIARPLQDDSGRVVELTVLDFNARAASISALPSEAITGATFFDAFPHSLNTELLQQCELVLRAHYPIEIEQFAPLPNQPIRWVQRQIAPHIDGIAVTSRDITERKLQDAALRESEAMLRGIIDGLEEGVLLHDTEGRVQLANRSAERIFGMNAQELISGEGRQHDWELSREDGTAWQREDLPLYRAIATGQYQSRQTVRIKRRDGSMTWLSIHAVPLVAPGTQGPNAFISTFIDVTAQRALEGQVREAHKTQAIAQLAGGVAHDFNNVLAIIRGSVEFLEPLVTGAVTARADLDTILEASDRGARLTKQLLSVSQRQVLEMRPCNISTLLHTLDWELQASMPEQVRLELDVQGLQSEVRVDRILLIDSIRSLLTRAIENVGGSGQIRLTVRTIELSAAEAFEHGVRPGPYSMLAVSDTGQSVDDMLREHLFEPFSQSIPFGNQTGMELAALRGFVSQCNGFIDYESTRLLGSTFRMHFPEITPTANKSGQYRSIPDNSVRASETQRQFALIVDDEPALRSLVSRQLELLGFRTETAADAEEGLEIVDVRGHELTLLVTDLTMPGMTGQELAHRVGSLFPALPIVLMSGYSESPLDPAAAGSSHIAFIPKPFSNDELRRIIESVQTKRLMH